MFFKSIIIFTLTLNFIKDGNSDKCKKELDLLAYNQEQFVRCSALHAVPVTLCTACEYNYTNLIITFKNFQENEECSNKYFDKDRINLVSTIQSILVGLWVRAFCDDCFSSNNLFIFNEKLSAFETCLKQNNNTKCVACLPKYQELNSFYKNLDQHNNGKVCYDLQDSMNRTQYTWSKELKCCHREFKITIYLVTTAVVTCFIISFYGSVYGITKRREINHDLLIEGNSNISTSDEFQSDFGHNSPIIQANLESNNVD